MSISYVNGAPPNQTAPLDARGRFTAPWYSYLVSLQKANSGVTVGAGGINLNGQTLTGSATFSGPVVFGSAPSFTNAAGTRANLGLGSAATLASTDVLQRTANLLDVANVATARINLGLGTAALASLNAMPAMTLTGTVNLNSVGFTGATLGNFTVGRAAFFATSAVIWSLNVVNAGGADNVALGQSSATYATGGGGIAWIGGSNAFLYFNSAQDFRIGAGVGATPIMTFKGAGRVLLGTLTDDGSNLLQIAGGVAFGSPASISFGGNYQTWTPTLTASGSMTITAITVQEARYLRVGPFVHFTLTVWCTLGGTASNTIFVNFPVAAVIPANALTAVSTGFFFPGAPAGEAGFGYAGASSLVMTRSGGGNYPLLSGVQLFMAGMYRVA